MQNSKLVLRRISVFLIILAFLALAAEFLGIRSIINQNGHLPFITTVLLVIFATIAWACSNEYDNLPGWKKQLLDERIDRDSCLNPNNTTRGHGIE